MISRWYHHAIAAGVLVLVLAIAGSVLFVASSVKDMLGPASALRTLGSSQPAPVKLDTTGLVQAAQRLGSAADALAAAKTQPVPRVAPPALRRGALGRLADRLLGRNSQPSKSRESPGVTGQVPGAQPPAASGVPAGPGATLAAGLPSAEEPMPRASIARTLIQPEQVIGLSSGDAAAYEKKYGLAQDTLTGRHRGGLDVLTEKKLKPAPQGGEVLVAQDQHGVTEVMELPAKRGFLGLGGLRETGGEWDWLNKRVAAYHRQDMVRVGPIVVGVRLSLIYDYNAVPAQQRSFAFEPPVTAGVRW
jgi:hypothetical protein